MKCLFLVVYILAFPSGDACGSYFPKCNKQNGPDCFRSKLDQEEGIHKIFDNIQETYKSQMENILDECQKKILAEPKDKNIRFDVYYKIAEKLLQNKNVSSEHIKELKAFKQVFNDNYSQETNDEMDILDCITQLFFFMVTFVISLGNIIVIMNLLMEPAFLIMDVESSLLYRLVSIILSNLQKIRKYVC